MVFIKTVLYNLINAIQIIAIIINFWIIPCLQKYQGTKKPKIINKMIIST